MRLFVCEIKLANKWIARSFWVGTLRLALQKFPDCRIRRVMSREEAEKLEARFNAADIELDEPWDLDTFDWEWPPTRMA